MDVAELRGHQGMVVPEPGDERFFRRDQEFDACAWAFAGGIAIHCRDRWSGAPVRVFGRMRLLLEWGRHHGLDARAVRARRAPAYFDVSGTLAELLIRSCQRQAVEDRSRP